MKTKKTVTLIPAFFLVLISASPANAADDLYQFEDNGNMTSARVLLQRGLRINPDNQQLWIEYFKLEMLWIEKIKERRKILFKKELDSKPGIIDP